MASLAPVNDGIGIANLPNQVRFLPVVVLIYPHLTRFSEA
jgi:hypothetical protein